MFKVYIDSYESAVSKKINELFPKNVELLTSISSEDLMNETFAFSADLVFIDFCSLYQFINVLPKTKVIVTSDTHDQKREYLSVMLGAKGFVTNDIDMQSLKKAISVVNAGQIWATRAVESIAFQDYRRSLKER